MKRKLTVAVTAAGLALSVGVGPSVGAGRAAGATVPAAPPVSHVTARPGAQATAAGGGQPVSVTFWGRGQAIPADFFGLSVEYNELHTYEQSGILFDRVLGMLRHGGAQRLSLRIGGKSADHTLWEPNPQTAPSRTSLPRGILQLGQGWLENLASLVRAEHLQVLLDLNLAVHSPSMAASFASAVRQALPAGALSGLEIGNEPDMYHFQPRLSRERVATTIRATSRRWWSNYSNSNYRSDYVRYARALRSRLGAITIGAPDITRPIGPWLTDLTNLGPLRPGFLAIHRYGVSGCFAPSSPSYPTVSNLLSNLNSDGLAASVAPWVGYAHARGMGLRVSEINSVSCGHDAGVADAFDTALWAPDTLFSMVRAGVNGVSWHIRPGIINAPFQVVRGSLRPEPELYGLALFSMMTQGPARLLWSGSSSPSPDRLAVWTVKSGRTFRVLLINKGWQTLQVSLRGIRQVRQARVRRLTAPGVRATGGVRFAGQRIGSDALWHGTANVQVVRLRGGHYHLRVGPYSAAMVSF